MNVRDVMTSPAKTVKPHASVAAVARLMLDHGVPGLPVVDDSGKVKGLVTKRDLVAKHAQVHLPRYFGILGTLLPLNRGDSNEEMRHVLAITAQDLMEEPRSISPDGSIDEAASLMVEHSADPILVMDGEKLLGIIGYDDIIRILLVEEEGAASDGVTTS